MLFHTLPFLLGFLPLCVVGHRALAARAPRLALPWLLLCSLGFYAWWRADVLPLLLGSIAANYALSVRIRAAAHPRAWFAAGCVANLALLGWFKYAGFVAGAAGLDDPQIVLPLAISFFTFQQIMFLRETAQGHHHAVPFTQYASFVAFFPHLIAGPLVRPSEIIPQLAQTARARPDIAGALLTLLLGLAKKLVLADTFAHYADAGFDAAAAGHALTLVEAWVAVLAYSLQIYFDFSGYSDMAIGLAALFGVRFPLNFDSPYQSRSVGEFWRRWHITLGAFLRDHVFIPLGGSRAGRAVTARNLFATMLLGGLWHGAAWTFVAWGALHGAYLVIEAAGRALLRVPARAAQGLTLLAVIWAWVPFRADGFAATASIWGAMLGVNGVALPARFVAMAPALGHIAAPVPVLLYLGDARTLALPEALACLAVGWFIVLALPNIHRMGERLRTVALTSGFAFTVQALVFAPVTAPFLYFRF